MFEWKEELLDECRSLLLDVSFLTLSYDVWEWLSDPSGDYSVRGLYAMLTTEKVPQVLHDVKLIWHKQKNPNQNGISLIQAMSPEPIILTL